MKPWWVQCFADTMAGALHLTTSAVAPTHHGKGIGKRLVQECVTGLRKAGITRALIFVAPDNPGGHAFWLRNGWEEVEGVILMGIDL